MINSMSQTKSAKVMAKLFIGGLITCMFSASALAQWVIYEESFANGLGEFAHEGRVYSEVDGARLRGGPYTSSLTSLPIDVGSYDNLSISFDRKVIGLDVGESAQLQVSVDGGIVYTVVESIRAGEGRSTISLSNGIFQNARNIIVRFMIRSSSFFEKYEVSNLVVEGRLNIYCSPGAVCDNYPSFNYLIDQRATRGRCFVESVDIGDFTLYIPSDPAFPLDAKFNILVWGNGAGSNANTYRDILDSVASQCIVVAAANMNGNVSGVAMAEALNVLRSNFSESLQPDARICAAGHGLGSTVYNAAPLVNADCVITVAPDTIFQGQIQQRLNSGVEAIALFSSGDTLSLPERNLPNLLANSNILSHVVTEGESYFAITQGSAANIGKLFRMATIAQLSTDEHLRTTNRRVFFGPETYSRATAENPKIHEVFFNNGALGTTP